MSEDYEIDEEYNKIMDKIIYNIFGNKYKLIEEDYKILDKVRTHKNIDKNNNYEILETLGDGLLKPIIIQSIMETCQTKLSESYISELRMLLERTEIFSYLLTKYFGEIEDYINFIQTSNPYDYEKIKEDIFEALIGGIYQIIYNYSNMNKTKYNLLKILYDYYKEIFKDYINELQKNKDQMIVNYIKQLSEYCLKHNKKQPIYKSNKINMRNGEIIYDMKIILDDHIEHCKEKTEKQAKQTSAYLMLKYLGIIQDTIITNDTNIKDIMW